MMTRAAVSEDLDDPLLNALIEPEASVAEAAPATLSTAPRSGELMVSFSIVRGRPQESNNDSENDGDETEETNDRHRHRNRTANDDYDDGDDDDDFIMPVGVRPPSWLTAGQARQRGRPLAAFSFTPQLSPPTSRPSGSGSRFSGLLA